MTKYRAKKVKTEDGTFDSQAEYRRWCELKLFQNAKLIEGLRRQQTYVIGPPHVPPLCKYKADFTYYSPAGPAGKLVVEDVKGVATPVYRLKKKMLKILHGIEIQEVAA